MSALIFDCDGVLADTEKLGHLPAFNQAFREMGIPIEWSVDEYAEKVKIGGGKERMRSEFTADLAARWADYPADDRGVDELIQAVHARKTDIYTALIDSGRIPPRPGVGRLAGEAAQAGWDLAVASTSAEASVRAVLRRAVGDDLAQRFAVFAGDVVPRKKPAPDIYLLALERLGTNAEDAVVIEDSGIGLRAARAAGIATVVTVSTFTEGEDFGGAALVLPDLDGIGLADLDVLRAKNHTPQRERAMGGSSVETTRFVLEKVAKTVVDNEGYFGELDAVVGDGDFGFSLARGFEKVLTDVGAYPDGTASELLRAAALTISSRVGGTSGPIWGTAFLRASMSAKGLDALRVDDVVAMLRAAVDGIQTRGKAQLGDKTLLDALIPATDALAQGASRGLDSSALMEVFATTMRETAERTSELQALRGRASYSGERSIGSPDAGAIALAVLAESLVAQWPQRPGV